MRFLVNMSQYQYKKIKPNYYFESKGWRQGLNYIAGVDEVGRGSFAGPVVAGTVVFSPDIQMKTFDIRIDDSKKLTKLQREKADKWIKKNAAAWSIGEVSARIINRVGMSRALKIAIRRAVNSTNNKLQGNLNYLLLDAFYIPYLQGFPKGKNKIKGSKEPEFTVGSRQLAIIKGDQLSISIASASIIAKVYRDKLMEKIGERVTYKKYNWVKNKGYATKLHQKAILKYGITGYHRKQFVDTFLSSQ